MPQLLKMAAFLCCLTVWVAAVLRVAMPTRTAAVRPGHLDRRVLASPESAGGRVASLVPLVLAEAGAVVLLVDAARRDYDSPSGLPVALAVMGLMCGMTSVAYYAGWGWRPYRREVPPEDGGGLCGDCRGSTLDRPAPRTGTVNLLGTRLLGAAERCPRCGSVVKTLWVCAGVPVVPLGSYRVKSFGSATVTTAGYVGRRLPGVRWDQVAGVFAVLLTFAAVVAGLVVWHG